MKTSDIEMSKEAMNIEFIQRLNAGRIRSREKELAREAAASAAAKGKIEITEP